jgi:hypothetical protein
LKLFLVEEDGLVWEKGFLDTSQRSLHPMLGTGGSENLEVPQGVGQKQNRNSFCVRAEIFNLDTVPWVR